MKSSFNKYLTTSATAALVAAAFVPAASAATEDTTTTTDSTATQDTTTQTPVETTPVVTTPVHTFTDVSARYDEAVSFLYSNKIVNGKTTTKFGTQENITRGDAAVILAGALGLDTENAEDAGFTDLNDRVRGSVNALAEVGIVALADKYNPSEQLSRGAMAKFLVLGYGLEGYEVETPFVDAKGVFTDYIEALYGTGITSGKTETTFGTHLDITRGEFANLLFNTINFIEENSLPFAKSVQFTGAKSFDITFEEAIKEEFTAQDVVDATFLTIQFEDGSQLVPEPSTIKLSDDRLTLSVTHEFDLTGKQGTIFVDEIQQAFDFKNPVAGKGKVTLEGATAPVEFDFAGQNTTSLELTATEGIVNLNAMEMNVTDTYATDAKVTVILKDTNVDAVKPGIDKTWGTLEYKEGKWVLVDSTNYDIIPVGTYVLEAPFKDASNNTTTLTLNIEVK